MSDFNPDEFNRSQTTNHDPEPVSTPVTPENNQNPVSDETAQPENHASQAPQSQTTESSASYFNHLHDGAQNTSGQQNGADPFRNNTYQQNTGNFQNNSYQQGTGNFQNNSYQQNAGNFQNGSYQQNTGNFQNGSYQQNTGSNQNDSSYHYSYVKPEKPKKKHFKNPFTKKGGRFVMKLIASALVFGLVAGCAFQGFNYVYYKANPTAKSGIDSTVTLRTGNSTIETFTDLSEMVENVMPSIVSITSIIEQKVNYGFWGGEGTEESEGAGSGIIIGQNDKELLIVTNNHVIEGAKKISVGFNDKTDAAATVKGTDVDADIAVVSVPLETLTNDTKAAIKVATLGDSDKLKVGEPAIAIGNALGYGQSVTGGYVSALNREVFMTDKTMTLLQTDAAINPGNSGGALLNMKGEVIGINTLKFSDTTVESMGYAIPINTAAPIIKSLMNEETIPESQQAYLGITGSDLTEEYAKQLGMPAGIYVRSVQSGSPAEKAGIYAGDVITKFDDISISSMESLINKLSRKRAGATVNITVQRMNQQGTYDAKNLKVILGSKKDMQ